MKNIPKYLQPTRLLDYNTKEIKELIQKAFSDIGTSEKIEKIYYFVRDEIKFGYNESDDIPASQVLKDGYGQCNTKTTLFMALARAVGIPSRAHLFKINKKVQKGIFPTHIYERYMKEELIHSWPEIYLKDRWIILEGIILDNEYLEQIKKKFRFKGQFEGYGISVLDLSSVNTNWSGKDTYIQKKSITKDEGMYASPDEYYQEYGTNMDKLEKFFFKCFVKPLVNKKVKNIRKGKW